MTVPITVSILETPRLSLRPFTGADAPFILGLLNEPAFLRFVGDKQVRTEEDARAYIREGPLASYARHGFGMFLVTLRAGDVPAGMCGLMRRDWLPSPDLGFAITEPLRGQGLAREITGAYLDRGLPPLDPVALSAIVDPGNLGSRRVLEGLGFTPAGEVTPPGDGRSILHYRWQGSSRGDRAPA